MTKKLEKELFPQEPAYLRGIRPQLIIFIAVFCIYLPTLWYGFSPMDERWVILQNKEVMSDLLSVPDMFTQSTLGMYYRPVWTSSFIIDMVVGNGSPWIFHLTNILLHALCALLVYKFLIQLKISSAVAFFSALLFAAHPINVHTVTWIPGRNDSLLCLFTLLSCFLLVNYFTTKKTIYLLFHLLAFCLALFSKENAIVLPFVYFSLWYFFYKEKNKKEIFLLLFSWLIIGVAWFALRKHFISYLPPLTTGSVWDSITQSIAAIALYIGKIILPLQQSVMPVLKDTSLLLPVILTLALILLTLRAGVANKKLALFGLGWFFIFIMIPVWVGATNSNREHYEHRIYTSLVGMFIFLSQLKIRLKPILAQRISLLVIILFSAGTIMRSAVYKDETSFLEAATREAPSVAFFHDMLGFKYAQRKEFKNALEQFNQAIRLNPGKAEFYNNRGNVYYEMKNYELALADFDKGIKDELGLPVKLVNRSMTYFYLGNHAAALQDIKQAQQIGAQTIPGDYIEALYTALQHDTIALCTEKLKTDSLNATLLNQRGIAQMRLGLFRQALADFNRALELRPNSDAIRANRQLALSNVNRVKK
jgi:tetratricopeptide (TPR) repeat protein